MHVHMHVDVYISTLLYIYIYIYIHTCTHNIFEGKESVSTLSEIRSVNTERIRALMESGNNRSLNSLQSAITYYQSCMNILATDQKSASDLNSILHTLGN